MSNNIAFKKRWLSIALIIISCLLFVGLAAARDASDLQVETLTVPEIEAKLQVHLPPFSPYEYARTLAF